MHHAVARGQAKLNQFHHGKFMRQSASAIFPGLHVRTDAARQQRRVDFVATIRHHDGSESHVPATGIGGIDF